ncbi:MAG: CpaF family protein [Candidatus Micrarchaeia archaeon]
MVSITPGYPFSYYAVEPLPLDEDEQKLSEEFVELVLRKTSPEEFSKKLGFADAEVLDNFLNSVDGTRVGKPLKATQAESFKKNIEEFCKEFDVDGKKVAREVFGKVYGYKVVQPLFEDDALEEIMINGLGLPVLAYHRQRGICKTNLVFRNSHELGVFISQLDLPLSDKKVVFEDLKLADNSRANITFPPATHNTVVTIRKFRKQPMSVVDLVENGTLSKHLAAFLWVCVDGMLIYPLNILVAGGTASGKTTTLNALSAFVPPSERIISIEDTLELNLSEIENWVALESGRGITLEGLLENSLRMRPDRLVIGEVRGEEAEGLFTAMNIGHRGTLGTLHANSDRDAVKRLENAPMNVPRGLIPLADLIVVQHRVHDRKKGLIRRVIQVSEVSRIEDEIALNEIYKWNPREDVIENVSATSEAIEKLAKASGRNINHVREEVKRRIQLMDYMIKHNVRSQREVGEFMRAYYSEMLMGGKKK